MGVGVEKKSKQKTYLITQRIKKKEKNIYIYICIHPQFLSPSQSQPIERGILGFLYWIKIFRLKNKPKLFLQSIWKK